jgi:hypothetical protein
MSVSNFLIAVSIGVVASAGGAEAQQAAARVELTIRTPQPERFELQLDEIELVWRPDNADLRAQSAVVGTPRAVMRSRSAGRATFTARDVTTLETASALARELEQQNPGAVAHLVLHEAGRPPSEATRRLLGREVALIVDPAVDPAVLLGPAAPPSFRRVASVPGAYVIEAADPAAALALADRLRETAGVRGAYPLLKRQLFPR